MIREIYVDTMFFQLPEEDKNIYSLPNNLRRKRKKQAYRKKKHSGHKAEITKRKNSRFAITMSTWAENFTSAATWQLKHQIAYWKSKAKALEYENQILHEIIRKNYVNTSQDEQSTNCVIEQENELAEQIDDEQGESDEQGDGDDQCDGDEHCDGNESDIEVSEEFIQFLKTNAKYKQEARQERERLKALHNAEVNLKEEMEPGPSETAEDNEETLKMLYGKHWQRISALEISLQCKFISECDSEKPMHWPNIPFNFSFN